MSAALGFFDRLFGFGFFCALGFDRRHKRLFVNSFKERFGFGNGNAGVERLADKFVPNKIDMLAGGFRFVDVGNFALCRDHAEYFFGGVGNDREEQYRRNSYSFQQVVKYRSETRGLRFVLRQHPRLGLVDILIRAAEQSDYRVGRVGDTETVHALANRLVSRLTGRRKFCVDRFFSAFRLNYAAEILVLHRDGTLDEVAERVDEVAVVSVENVFVSYTAVRVVGHLREGVVAHAVDREFVGEFVGVNDVTFRLRHFVGAEIEPRVTEHLFGKRQVKRH